MERGERWIAGRGPGVRLRSHDASLSRRHAQLCLDGGLLRVEDLDSTNGIWLGGERVEQASLRPDQSLLLGRRPLLLARRAPEPAPEDTVVWQGIWARSKGSLRLLERAAVMAHVDAPVWIHGASGTGKEGLARALHFAGPRARGPWIALNCAALPEQLAEAELFGVVRGAFTGADRDRKGAFERAHGGTLFLDEVGELSLALQAKLLRAVEGHEITPVGGAQGRVVDVRIVVATWSNLERAASRGTFRFDLLQRLSTLRLDLRSLRDRPRDVPALYAHFLLESGGRAERLDSRLVADLESRIWPGNARGVRAFVLNELLGDLRAPSLRRSVSSDHGPRTTALQAVARYGGNRSEAARALGVSRSTLYRWLGTRSRDAPSPTAMLGGQGRARSARRRDS